MRNLPFCLIFVSISILSSCSKNNSLSNSKNRFLPRTYTEDVRSSIIGNSVKTYNLTYDGNGRLTALSAIPTPPSINFIYTYSTTNSVTMDLYQSGILNIHEILWLNTSSFLDTTFQFNDTGDTTTEKYIYNGNRQLIQENIYNYSKSGTTLYNSTKYTYDNLGNVITSVDSLGNSYSYTYYSNLSNNFNIGQTFLPQPVNFLKTQILSSGGTTETSNHYYTFDSNNRLIQDSSYTVEVNLIAIKSYTY